MDDDFVFGAFAAAILMLCIIPLTEDEHNYKETAAILQVGETKCKEFNGVFQFEVHYDILPPYYVTYICNDKSEVKVGFGTSEYNNLSN